MGGQSAFGTKAGDLFTKITIGVASFWIVLCIVCVIVLPKVTAGPLGFGRGAAPRQSAARASHARRQPANPPPPRPRAPPPAQVTLPEGEPSPCS